MGYTEEIRSLPDTVKRRRGHFDDCRTQMKSYR